MKYLSCLRKVITLPLFTLPLLTLTVSTTAQAASFTRSNDPDTVLLWTDATLQAISQSKTGPTAASRAIGMTVTSIYDTWAAYDPDAISTQPEHNVQVSKEDITLANKQTAISHAAYRTLSDLFPAQQDIFDSLMDNLGYDFADAAVIDTSKGIGNNAANQLLAYRHKDGANQLSGYSDDSNYTPVNTWETVNNPERWQPISLDNGETVQSFLTPHWNQVTPFALTSADQFLPPSPKSFLDSTDNLNSAYVDQVLEVIEYSAELTDTEKVIAEYWADGPETVLPPGHWIRFGEYVSERDQLSFDENVKLFFALGNAVSDAGIAAWDAKVQYDYVRPVTAVQYLSKNNLLPTDHPYVRLNSEGETEIFAWGGPNQGAQWILGEDWLPYQDIEFVTPPFAEYVSGHSTFSTAGAEILQLFTGSDLFGLCHTELANSSTFEDVTPVQPVELCWDTFTVAADEAGLSRLYGGIHFRDGDVNGRVLGRAVGQEVWLRSQQYINGTRPTASVPEPSSLLAIVAASLWGFTRKKQSKKVSAE